MHPEAAALIQILRASLEEVDQNSRSSTTDISSLELRTSILRAIDELELMRTGSHELQAA